MPKVSILWQHLLVAFIVYFVFQYTNVGCSANENLLPPQPQLTQTKFDKKSSQTTGNAISRTERGLSLNVLTTFWQIKIEERENFEC